MVVFVDGDPGMDLQSEFVADPRTVDVHVRNVRRKIERDAADPERLVSVRGYGYKLASDREL